MSNSVRISDDVRVGHACWLLSLQVELSDSEDTSEHALQLLVVQGHGGEPQRAVGDTGSLRTQVENISALPH